MNKDYGDLLKMVNIKEFNEMIGKVVSHRNTFNYILLYVQDEYALVRVKSSISVPRGYEVWKLRVRTSNHKYDPNGVWLPGNNDFGYFGWSYNNKEDALAKYSELRNKR